MVENEKFETFCNQHDILIHFADDLTTKVRGYCYYDGIYYNVILNNKFDENQLRKTTVHEIIHVLEEHFLTAAKDVEKCEQEVEKIVEDLYKEFIFEFSYVWGGKKWTNTLL